MTNMNDTTFRRILFALVAVGLISAIALVVYTILIYPNSSLIAFISREWW